MSTAPMHTRVAANLALTTSGGFNLACVIAHPSPWMHLASLALIVAAAFVRDFAD